jgi:hypothetical protein
VVLVAALIAIAILASLDAFRGREPNESSRATVSAVSTPSATTTTSTTTGSPPPIWEGEHQRTMRLGPRAGARWEETRVLDPGSYEVTMRLDLPAEADVEVWLQSGAAFTLGLFGRRVPRDCQRLKDRRVCAATVPFPQAHSEEWTLAVAKRSPGRALVHLTLEFARVPPT